MEAEVMEAEVENERNPTENNGGYREPPFAALLSGEQPEQSRQSNRNDRQFRTGGNKRDQQQSDAGDAQFRGSRHAMPFR